MSNITRHPQCLMRTPLGNCDPLGGFCTSVNESICEALHKVSRPQAQWIDKGDYAVCSNCGTSSGTQFDGVEPIPLKSNFCAMCGARMITKDKPINGILFKGRLEEGKYTLIKTTDGWVLDGEDIAYAGFDIGGERSER